MRLALPSTALIAAAAPASGDTSGDGKDDLIIGALLADGPDSARTNAGEAYVILSRSASSPQVCGVELLLGSGHHCSERCQGTQVKKNTGGAIFSTSKMSILLLGTRSRLGS